MTSDGKQTFSEFCLVQTAVLRTTERKEKKQNRKKDTIAERRKGWGEINWPEDPQLIDGRCFQPSF